MAGLRAEDTAGLPIAGSRAVVESTANLMARARSAEKTTGGAAHVGAAQASEANAESRDADAAAAAARLTSSVDTRALKVASHSTSASFDAVSLNDAGTFPPDPSGSVGPTQVVVGTSGWIRSFTKNGVADGVLNLSAPTFFSSVMTPGAVANALRYLHIRYDRFTARWFIAAVDNPTGSLGNRWLLAVSDATSNGVITANTVWTYFFFQANTGDNRCESASLGIDVNALYVGCNTFTTAGTYLSSDGFVVRKSSVLGAGPMTVTQFPGLVASVSGAGPFTPRGVDNTDPNTTEGYFVGVDNAQFSLLVVRRVTNPGTASPSISSNLNVSVPTTSYPSTAEHAGNTGGPNGRLSTAADSLLAATMRSGRLWTAHNIGVSSAGVASSANATARVGVRWYELQNLNTVPALRQSGTVYDNAATRAAAREYIYPTATVTGQGHSVLGFTMAGTPVGATPAYVSRQASDTLGTMTGPPGAAATTFGTTAASYNPPADPGSSSGRKWGSYSQTVVDPLDEMTVYTMQLYNQAANSFALRVGRLRAPRPAEPVCLTTPINFAGPTGDVVVDGLNVNGSGFFDPGPDLAPPARPFNRISASVSNATVNSVTYNNALRVTLNITAHATGPLNMTITNPDGQQFSVPGCIVAQNAQPKRTIAIAAIPSQGGSVSCAPNPVLDGQTSSCNATPANGFSVSSWIGSCGGTASGAGNVNFTTGPVSADCSVTAVFGKPVLNIDNSDAPTTYDAATDGVILMRYLLGFRGSALIDSARGIGGNIRDSSAIESHLLASLALLDVDGDGQSLATTDGVMILRRLLNPTASISNAAALSAITANAKRGTRTDAEIVSAIDALKP